MLHHSIHQHQAVVFVHAWRLQWKVCVLLDFWLCDFAVHFYIFIFCKKKAFGERVIALGEGTVPPASMPTSRSGASAAEYWVDGSRRDASIEDFYIMGPELGRYGYPRSLLCSCPNFMDTGVECPLMSAQTAPAVSQITLYAVPAAFSVPCMVHVADRAYTYRQMCIQWKCISVLQILTVSLYKYLLVKVISHTK